MRTVKITRNYRGEYVANADEIANMHMNWKVQWWVAKIVGVHPRWIFAREFLPKRLFTWSKEKSKIEVFHVVVNDVKPRDVLEVHGGSWKHSYRAYVVVEDIDFNAGTMTVRDISAEEARELAEQMGVKPTIQLPSAIADIFGIRYPGLR